MFIGNVLVKFVPCLLLTVAEETTDVGRVWLIPDWLVEDVFRARESNQNHSESLSIVLVCVCEVSPLTYRANA